MNDLRIAKKYINKANSARQSGTVFDLNWTSFKNVCKAKKCYYTGLTLTDGDGTEYTDRTIDRIDSNKGYVSGNVVACSLVANRIKGTIESGAHGWSIDLVRAIINKIPKDYHER